MTRLLSASLVTLVLFIAGCSDRSRTESNQTPPSSDQSSTNDGLAEGQGAGHGAACGRRRCGACGGRAAPPERRRIREGLRQHVLPHARRYGQTPRRRRRRRLQVLIRDRRVQSGPPRRHHRLRGRLIVHVMRTWADVRRHDHRDLHVLSSVREVSHPRRGNRRLTKRGREDEADDRRGGSSRGDVDLAGDR